MRVAALYDIHGNLPALRAVLAEAAGEHVDLFVIGGDVADGPMPSETIDELMLLSDRARFVLGNTDREVIDAYDHGRNAQDPGDDLAARAGSFAAGQISRAQRDFLSEFSATVELELDGLGDAVFCHGSPRSDVEIITRATPDGRLERILDGIGASLVVGGHVHQRYDRSVSRWRVVNPGSVGMPYEGEPGAYWALLGAGVELRRTEYDLELLRASSFSDIDEWLMESLFEPADPAFVTELFERQAAGSA
jgi:predicted phosphodiesterase